MPVRYILSTVWVRLSMFSQLCTIQYMGLCVFSLPISLVMIERIYTYIRLITYICYYHYQIGSMDCYPLLRVRSWNNGMRCMFLYILMGTSILRFPTPTNVNSMAPERCGSNFTSVLCEIALRINTLSTSCEIGRRWVPKNPIDGKSTLVQVMVWCRQAARHDMSQRRRRYLSPSDVTRTEWVKIIIFQQPKMQRTKKTKSISIIRSIM